MRYPQVPVAFNMLNMKELETSPQTYPFVFHHIENIQAVKFDLETYITEYEEGVSLSWVCRKSLYSPGKIEYIAGEYLKIVDFFKNNFHKNYREYKTSKKKYHFRRDIDKEDYPIC